MDFRPVFIVTFLLLVHKSFGNHYFEWVSPKQFKPDKQELAGTDGDDDLFIGRYNDPDGQVIAAYHPLSDFQYVDGENVETAAVSKIQVLQYCRGGVTWTRRSTSGLNTIPANVLLCGFSPASGENVYACRARKGNKMIPGQLVGSSTKGCHILDDGEPEYAPEYEVASISLYGVSGGCMKY